MKDPNCIQLWYFAEAPEHLRNLSDHGGDEDWLYLIPREIYEDWGGFGPWEKASAFCKTYDVPNEPDYVVVIQAHA